MRRLTRAAKFEILLLVRSNVLSQVARARQTAAHPDRATRDIDVMPFQAGAVRSGFRQEDAIALVATAYRFVLGREPDPEGLGSYVTALVQGRSATWLLEALGASDEYRSRNDPVAARLERTGLISAVRKRAVVRASALQRLVARPLRGALDRGLRLGTSVDRRSVGVRGDAPRALLRAHECGAGADARTSRAAPPGIRAVRVFGDVRYG